MKYVYDNKKKRYQDPLEEFSASAFGFLRRKCVPLFKEDWVILLNIVEIHFWSDVPVIRR